MRKLSIGEDSTLGNNRKCAVAVFGENSKAVKYLDDLIIKSPHGADEEVIADESQFVNLLCTIEYAKDTV